MTYKHSANSSASCWMLVQFGHSLQSILFLEYVGFYCIMLVNQRELYVSWSRSYRQRSKRNIKQSETFVHIVESWQLKLQAQNNNNKVRITYIFSLRTIYPVTLTLETTANRQSNGTLMSNNLLLQSQNSQT